MEDILKDQLKPIGSVISDPDATFEVLVKGLPAAIKIYPAYIPAMLRMEEHNYFWVLCWFHKANRAQLRKIPGVNTTLPEYGVFGLRTPPRPNPISLTLVKLERIEGDTLYVTGLDAMDGTPVLDIKPYYEADIVFSPQTPYIPPGSYDMRAADFRRQAMAHHGEACFGLELGVKMALLAEDLLGKIQSPDLKLTVEGDACLADVLQGLTRARLANPPRFVFRESAGTPCVVWQKNGETIKITPRPEVDHAAVAAAPERDLFAVEKL